MVYLSLCHFGAYIYWFTWIVFVTQKQKNRNIQPFVSIKTIEVKEKNYLWIKQKIYRKQTFLSSKIIITLFIWCCVSVRVCFAVEMSESCAERINFMLLVVIHCEPFQCFAIEPFMIFHLLSAGDVALLTAKYSVLFFYLVVLLPTKTENKNLLLLLWRE